MQIIETSRLTLRYITIKDAKALIPILGDPEVMRYSIIGVHNRPRIRQFIEQRLLSYLECGFGLYAVINKKDEEFMGYCGFFVQSVDDRKEVEIGYRLAKKYWGQGYATEAAQAVLKYGRERYNFKRFVCLIDPENTGSINVAKKLGMELEKKTIYHGLNVEMYSINCE